MSQTDDTQWFVRATYYPEVEGKEPLPENVRERCDDPEETLWKEIDPTNIRAYRCVGCKDLIYPVQVGEDWADLDKFGDDRGIPDHVNDGQTYTCDPDHPGEWLCGWCREDFLDYPASTHYALVGEDVTALLVANGCFTEHYNYDTYTSVEDHLIGDALIAFEYNDDPLMCPAVDYVDLDGEEVYVEEGEFVQLYPEDTQYGVPNHWGVRDSFVEKVLDREVALHSPAIVAGSRIWVNENALDFSRTQYVEFAENY